jgi:hypothetical protein
MSGDDPKGVPAFDFFGAGLANKLLYVKVFSFQFLVFRGTVAAVV